jgi:hypothetical protein
MIKKYFKIKFLFLEIYAYRINKFSLEIRHSMSDAIEISLGFLNIIIFYKNEKF